jgi:8-oxo-dGTP pyrophosphatase MutT (NUDIX family)
MTFEQQIQILQEKIASGKLPGKEAQIKMVSDAFKDRYFDIKPNAHTREGAVLILLYPQQQNLHLPLIVRPHTEKGVHSGQVAFPGGKKEKTDPDFVYTALREAQEEVNLDISKVRVLGQLSPLFVFASNFMVYPTLAVMHEKPFLRPNPQEVADIFSTNLTTLQRPETIKRTIIQTPQYTFETPYFDIEGKIVWGATAMMLSELIELAEISS